jgi:RND family efflux transporter MFP subunit
MEQVPMKRILRIVIPVVILGSLITWRVIEKQAAKAALAQQRVARASAPPKVSVAVAQVRDLENTFEATGTLESPQNVKISPKVTGRINFLQVHEGDRVRRGQVLVRIDADDVEGQVRQQQAALAEARYRLAQAQATEAPVNVGVSTQIKQQVAAVASAQADYDQVRQNVRSQVAAAEAGVTDVQGRVDSANAAIGNAKAAINSAQANLNNATSRYNRAAGLFKQGFIAAQDVDDAKATVAVQQAAVEVAQGQLHAAQASHDSAMAQRQSAEQQLSIVRTKGQADIEAARQKLAQAKAALEYARANTAQRPAYREGLAALEAVVSAAQASLASAEARRADTVLTSPLDGYVTSRFTDVGGLATPGQPILAVQFFGQVWVAMAVPDNVSASLHFGQSASVTFDALPGQTFTASIIQINPSADTQGRQFTVRATLDNKQGLFRPGMFAHVTVVTQRAAHAVAVPREALQKYAAGDYVVVVDAEGKATYRAVKVGMSDANSIAITQGLQAGETVVTMNTAPLKEGQKVQLPKADDKGAGSGGAKGAGGSGAPASQPPAPAGR